MQRAEGVGQQYHFPIEPHSNNLKKLKRPIEQPGVATKPQSADLGQTDALSKPSEETFQPELLTLESSRQQFLEGSTSAAGIENMPDSLNNAFEEYANNQSVKGLAIIGNEGGGALIKIIREPTNEETDVDRAKLSIMGMNLMLMGIDTEWVDMQGKPFEDTEKDIRDEVSKTPGGMLVAIFKFTD